MKKIIAIILGMVMCISILPVVNADVAWYEFSREIKSTEDAKSYCVITASTGGEAVWTYTTEAREITELENFSDIYQNGENAYFTAHGVLYALDITNGQLKWSANGVGGSNCFAFDKYGNVYVSGYYGPNVTVFDPNGELLYKDNDGSYCWVDALTIEDNTLNIHYGLDDLGNDDGIKTLDLGPIYAIIEERSGIKVTLNGEKILFDQPPVSIDGRTMVPLRAVVEKMGGSIEWDQETSTTDIRMNGSRMQLVLGSKTAFFDGDAYPLDVEPQAINGRILLPLRFVAEKFGFSVGWDGDTKTVLIETN